MHLQRLDLGQKLIAVRLVLVSFLAADTLFTVNPRWDTFSFFVCPTGTCLDAKRVDCDFTIAPYVPCHALHMQAKSFLELLMELTQPEELCRGQEGNICDEIKGKGSS